MTTTKKNVSIAVMKARSLRAQRLKENAEKRRALETHEIVIALCRKLLPMRSLDAMQDYVHNFVDSRADTICNAVLEATTLEAAKTFLANYKYALEVIEIQHCYDYSTGVCRHVFRIKEPGMIPRHEVVSNDYLAGLAQLEKLIHSKKTGGIPNGNYIMKGYPPWAPYHEIPPAVAQRLLRKQQREKGSAWSLNDASQTRH